MKIDIDSTNKFIKSTKTILKKQQRFKNERHTVFTAEISRITSSLNDHKRIQSIDSIETYTYGISKDLEVISDKEGTKCSNIVKRYKKRLT